MQSDSSPQTDAAEREVVRRALAGDRRAFDELLESYRPRLRRMIELRISTELRARVDASDVIQETFLEASERLADYATQPKTSFFLWVRYLARQRLVSLYRHHVDVKARDARRELSIYNRPGGSSAGIASRLVGNWTSPTKATERAEITRVVEEALEALDPIDREVLVLRHFEQLSNREIAAELDLDVSAASKRYIRAVGRLRTVIERFGLPQ